MLKEIKRGLLRNNRDIKQTGMKNHIVRIIPLVNSHSNPVRSSSNLNNSISNTTIILLTLLSRNYKESIRQFKKSSIIHIVKPNVKFYSIQSNAGLSIAKLSMRASSRQPMLACPMRASSRQPMKACPMRASSR